MLLTSFLGIAVYGSRAFAAEIPPALPLPTEDQRFAVQQTESVKQTLPAENSPQEPAFAFSDVHPLKTVLLKIDTDGVFTLVTKDKIADYDFYIIPQECVPAQDSLRKVIAEGTCDQLLSFTISQAGGYDFSLLSKSILAFANCSRPDRDCSAHPDNIRLLYASKPFEKKESARQYGLDAVVDTKQVSGFVQIP